MFDSIQEHWLSNARRQISPNFNLRPQGAEIDLLVLHNISLPPGQFGSSCIEDFFLNQLDCTQDDFFRQIEGVKVSAHLLIKRDGEVVQFVPFDQRAWHAGRSCYQGRDECNDFSIGIELEGTDTVPYEAEQYAVLSQVCKTLIRHYPNMDKKHICGHSDIAPGRKTDPGESFDWDKLSFLLER